MKLKITIIFATLCLAVACTQNHGHIGRLFGSWYLYNMTCDGTSTDFASYGETFWSFQSDLIMVTNRDVNNIAHKSYGTWKETGNLLILDFSYTYDDSSDNNAYNPPVWLGLPKDANIDLEYVEKGSKTMTLRYIAADGKVYEYFLRKTY